MVYEYYQANYNNFKYRHILRVYNQHFRLSEKCFLEIIILHIILSISQMGQFIAMID